MTGPELIRALQRADAYPHPVEHIELTETHISWVLLTGRYAYKVKKPLRLDFLDFSSLERRRHYCIEELRLNRRLAPTLYLEVVPITGTPGRPHVGGDGAPIEYAVKMRQFPQDAQLDRMLAKGRLEPADLIEFAARLARFHDEVDRELSERYGDPRRVAAIITDNLAELRELATPEERAGLDELTRWCRADLQRHRARFAARARQGMIRECHGDLHLSNLVTLEDHVTAFDCIEFDPAFRWIDVIDDVAFLCMDLDVRGRSNLAWRFVDAYLRHRGDYAALRLFNLYRIHRSLVRAKVAALRRSQANDPDAAARVRDHVGLAERYMRPRRPILILMHGLSGSGKSWLAERLVGMLPALRLSSDAERKRLAGIADDARSGSAVGAGLYAPDWSRRTYQRLGELAREVLESGYHTIIDAAFLDHRCRGALLALATALGVPCTIIDCQAPLAVLEQRVRRRWTAHSDTSEADLAVLHHQLSSHDPLSSEERAHVLTLFTDREISLEQVAAQIRSFQAQ